jgi:GH24 family phage-related lysozyme (muramidase)
VLVRIGFRGAFARHLAPLGRGMRGRFLGGAATGALFFGGGMVSTSVAAGDASCGPSPGTNFASLSFAGGQQLGCFHNVVSSGGEGKVNVNWSASCPLSAGENPSGHYWHVSAVIKSDSPGVVYETGDSYAGTAQKTSEHGVFPFFITLPSSPRKVLSASYSWQVTLRCGNPAQDYVIGSGSCVLCRGATTADTKGRDYIKQWEGDCKKIGKKKVCGQAVLHEYDCDQPGKGSCKNKRGNCTIGWGHKLHDGKCVCVDPKATCTNPEEDHDNYYKGITEKKAQTVFDADVQETVKHITNTSPVPLSQCQMNALADFFFNFGPRKHNDRINRDLRAGDLTAVYNDVGFHYKYPDPGRQAHDTALLFSIDCEHC